MRSSIFAKWAVGHRIEAHIVLPAAMSLLLMGMYFSGNTFLQNLVAPTMKSMPFYSAREFGALEMLQNLLLLGVCFYSIRCFFAASNLSIKLFALLLLLLSGFTFLEEVDYGAHFIEYFTGQNTTLSLETWDRNWHNKTGPMGVQNVSYMKVASRIVMLAGFVIGPLLLEKIRHPVIRLLMPSKWMISTVVLIALLSLLAHQLDDAGYSIISGVGGNLDKNISEFGEMNMYYLLLLYTALLSERLIVRKNAPPDIVEGSE